MTNLLKNPGFEEGDGEPAHWRTFSLKPDGISYVWDDAKAHSGRRSVCVQGTGRGFGTWQQIVDVEPGRVYELKGYVAFEDVARQAECSLQLVFRNAGNRVVQMVTWPSHTGTREFALDFPYALKVRAPKDAAKAEVNLFLRREGKVWLDDVTFAPAPTGEIAGTVTCDGKPLENARVFIWGKPWDKPCETVTDTNGGYKLADIPVAFPRYILLAEKEGFRMRPVGDIEVKEGKCTAVDFRLEPGKNPDDLRVKFGSMTLRAMAPGPKIPRGATIPDDPTGYPEKVRPYLQPDEYIQSDHPDVIAKAKELVEALPPEDRKDTRKVAWALHEWISKNIDHDGVFSVARRGGMNQPFRDVTSGIWQTISGRGWCWGKSFLDWGYRPHELLKVNCGICVEHSWLFAAMCRSLNIPARTAVGSHEFYAQCTKDDGVWIHGGTTGGRTNYRERGVLNVSFEGGPAEDRFAVLSRPVLHEDWNAEHKGLWRERHPWREQYDGTPEGKEKALADLETFANTGEAPRTNARPSRREPRRPRQGRTDRAQEHEDMATQRRARRRGPSDAYLIHYSDVTINLLTMDEQRILDVRFPMVTATNDGKPEAVSRHWTNHPECVKRTWVEEIKNPPAEGVERWFHIEFDLALLLD